MSTFLPEPKELEIVKEAAKSARLSQICPLPKKSTNGPIVLCVVRNEKHRLPEFFAHHRSLGFERFIFIDNASGDGTREYILEQCDTGVFSTSEPFHWTTKHGWIMQVIERLGQENWFALLDADEHLIFAHCEKRTIHEFVAELEKHEMKRVRGCLIDMYSNKAVFGEHSPQSSHHESYPYFDADGYEQHRDGKLTVRTGGPRARMAAALGRTQSPALTKYPLFKLGKGEVAYNPHLVWPPLNTPQDPCLLGLKHYKFDAALASKVDYALKTQAYWNDSAEYALYRDWHAAHPGESLLYSGSAIYRSSDDFLARGLIDEVTQLAKEPTLQSKLERARSIGRARQFNTIQVGAT